MNDKSGYNIAAVISPPFVMYNQTTNTWSGYCIDLINEIRRITYFDYTLFPPRDSVVGNVNFETGKWNGVVRELMEGNADIAVGPIWVTVAREKVVDFTEQIFEDNGFLILMLKHQKHWPFLKFLQLVDYDVWSTFAISFILSNLFIFYFERHSPFSYSNCMEKYKDEPDDRFLTLKGCVWYCTCCITPEGGGGNPKNLSGKVASATWWLFTFVVVTIYTANLTAEQALDRLAKHAKSLDDLTALNMKYTMIENSSTYLYFDSMERTENLLFDYWQKMALNESLPDFEKSKFSIWEYPLKRKYTTLYRNMEATGLSQNMDEALEKMKAFYLPEKFAIISEAMTIKYTVMTNCDLKEVGDQFAKKPFAFAVQQGSPLKDRLNMALGVLKRQEILERLRKKWWDDNPERAHCSPDPDYNDGFGVEITLAIFVTIGVGVFVTLVILTVQYWWYCIHMRPSIVVTPPSLDTYIS